MCHLLTGKERVPISNLQNDHPYHTEPFWGTLYSKIWPFWNILNWAVHSKLSMGPFLSSQKIPQNSFGQRPWAILNKAQPSEPYWTIMNLNTNGIPSGSDNNDNLPPCCTRDRSIIFHWPPPHLTDPLNQHLSIVQKRICPFFPELRILSNLAPFKMVISF